MRGPLGAILMLASLAALPLGCGVAKETPKPVRVAVGPKTSPPKIEPLDKETTPPEKAPEKAPEKTPVKAVETPVEPKGSTKKTDDPPPPKPPVVRPGDEAARKAMHDIGIAHQLFTDERNRAPASAEELQKFLDKGSSAGAMLKDGAIVVIWSSALPADPAKTVLAYEATADKSGRRLVLTADYAPLVLSEAEFEKMPKVSPKGKAPEKK